MEYNHEVELVSVTKYYRDTVAVDSVSLSVRPAEFITLLGPSGCGKTTLLRIIGGFATPDSGSVILAGADVTSLPPYKRDVATVFQQYALFPHMTVYQNVAFGLDQRGIRGGEAKRRVSAALEMVDLTGLDNRRPSELSGGQQQRVALARSLVIRPKVLLLDEPLAALDLKLRKQMQLELKELQRSVGISFIFVTHDQEEALTMSDRIAVMNAGKLQQVGDARDVYERPANEFVAGFIGLSNIVEGTVAATNGDGVTVDIDGWKTSVSVTSDVSKPATGDRARLMIRPEKIRLIPNSDGNGIRGTVESLVYLGEATRFVVQLENGATVNVVEQNRDAATANGLNTGQKVVLNWDAFNSVLIQNSNAAK